MTYCFYIFKPFLIYAVNRPKEMKVDGGGYDTVSPAGWKLAFHTAFDR